MDNERGGGKHRVKWNHGGKPYERPQSLLRRVTTKVTEFLTPSWLSSVWGSSETDDDHQEVVVPAPTKESLNQPIGGGETSQDPRDIPSTSGESSKPRLANQSRRLRVNKEESDARYFAPAVYRGVLQNNNNDGNWKDGDLTDNQSECSENSVSTSGCSSMIPHPEKREYEVDVTMLNKSYSQKLRKKLGRESLVKARPPLHSAINAKTANEQNNDSVLDNHLDDSESGPSTSSRLSQSLWSDSRMMVNHSKPQPQAVQKPAFNVEVVRSPVWRECSLLNNDSTSHLSLCNGRPPTYGGASAYRRCFQPNSPYTPPSVRRQQVKVRPSANSNTEVMSSTARKILETLEKMSTPLTDAKKIPLQQSYLDSSLNASSMERKRNSLPTRPWSSAAKSAKAPDGPPRKQLMTPAMITIAPNLNASSIRPPQETAKAASAFDSVGHKSKSNDVASKEGQPSSAPPAATTVPPVARNRDESEAGSFGGGGGKMKQKRHLTHYSSRLEDEYVEPLELPSIALPITSLPTFKFSVHSMVPETKTSTVVATSVPSSTSVTYTFSSPIVQKVSASETNVQAKDQAANFKFSSPLAVPSREAAAWPESPSENRATMSAEPLGFGDKFKPVPGSWSCPSCMCSNQAVDSNCPACDTPKPGTSAAPPKAAVGFGDKFRPLAGSWSCPSCMCSNQSTDARCPACKTPKPGGVAVATAAQPIGFGDKFKPAAGSWECSACMLRNKNPDSVKCSACDTPKPGCSLKTNTAGSKVTASKRESSTDSASTSGFVTKTPSLGHDPWKKPANDTAWECDVCSVRNPQSLSRCMACKTHSSGAAALPTTKPSAASTATTGFSFCAASTTCSTPVTSEFKFGFTTASADAKTTTTTTSSEPQATGFVFGTSTAATPASTAASGQFKFGFTPTTTATTTATSATAVVTSTTASTSSGFVFGNASASESPKRTGFVFGSTPVTNVDKSKPETPAASAVTVTEADKDSGTCEPSENKKKRARDDTVEAKPSGSLPSINFAFPIQAPAAIPAVAVADNLFTTAAATAATTTTTAASAQFKFPIDSSAATDGGSWSLDNMLRKPSPDSVFKSLGTTTSTPESGGFSFGLKTTGSSAMFISGAGSTEKPMTTTSMPKTAFGSIATGMVTTSAAAPNPALSMGITTTPVALSTPSFVVTTTPSISFDTATTASITTPSVFGTNALSSTSMFGKPTVSTTAAPNPLFGVTTNTTTVPPSVFSSLPAVSSLGGMATATPPAASTPFSIPPVATGGFTFGGAQPSPAATPSFGTPTSAPLAFGTATTASSFVPTATTTASASSVFGNTSMFNVPTSGSAGGFGGFRASAPTLAPPPAYSAPTTTASAPVFGSAGTSAFNPTPAATGGFTGFGVPQQPQQPTLTTGFGTGAPSAASTGGGFNFNATPMLQFGSNLNPTASGGSIFQFTGNQSGTQQDASQTPFGQPTVPQQQPQQQPANQGLSFGNAPMNFAAAAPNPPSLFQFSAAPPTSNPFDQAGLGAGTNAAARPIRRAVRRRPR